MTAGPSERRAYALRSPATEEVFAYGAFLAPSEPSLFAGQRLPSFRLDGTRELLERLTTEHGSADDPFRLVVSPYSRQALEQGAMSLVPMLQQRPASRLADAGKMASAAVPLLAGPQGMTALLAAAAVMELAGALAQAFEALQRQLQSIQDKLDDDRRRDRLDDLAVAQSGIDIGKRAEVCLRAAGDIPSSIGIGSASASVDALWLKCRGSLRTVESRFDPILDGDERRADDYVKQMHQLLPYDIRDLQAELVILGAAGIAKLYLDSVTLAETQLKIGRVQALDALLEERAADVMETVGRARRLTRRLSRCDFASDVRPQGRRPLSGGFLTKLPEAMHVQRRFRQLDDLVADVLGADRFSVQTADWVELELRIDGNGVTAVGRSHGATSTDLTGDQSAVVQDALAQIAAEESR